MNPNPRISLKAARVNANLTRDKAAKLIGINPSTLKNWEDGKTEPTMVKFRDLCELYDIPPDFIFLSKS